MIKPSITFHENLLENSLFNLAEIKSSFAQALSLEHIVHLSINIINPHNEIMFLSSTPNTGINVCGTDLWHYDSSITPEIFMNKDSYFWDDCYSKSAFLDLKKQKEIRNGISCGFIAVKRVNDFVVMYSYGLDKDSPEFRNELLSFKKYLLEIGDSCFKKIHGVYARAAGSNNILEIRHIEGKTF